MGSTRYEAIASCTRGNQQIDGSGNGRVALFGFLVSLCIAIVTGSEQSVKVVPAGQHSETCSWEFFRANCTGGQVIYVDSARYGRILRGRCAQMNADERPCFIDVRQYVERQCAGRRSCEIQVPNRDIELIISNTCSKDLKFYLDVSYHCQEVYTANDQQCITNHSLTVTASAGYLANIVTDEANKGSSSCPWRFELLAEQTVHLTLLDFAVYRNSTSPERSDVCHIYAVTKDSYTPSESAGGGFLVCGGKERETLLLTSTAKEVQISINKLNLRATDHIYFLIKYEVSGCPEFTPPEGASVDKISSGFRVTCRNRDPWEVRCIHGKWDPSANRSCPDLNLGTSTDAVHGTGLHQGILIVIVISIAIVVSAFIIVVGIFLLHRKRTFSPGEGLLESPTFDKNGVALYHTPMLGKRYLTPVNCDRSLCDLERDYATTLQMRQMVLPSAVIQSDCHSIPGSMPGTPDGWMCPVHGMRTAGIATGNGTLQRRFNTFRPHMEQIYELPVFEVGEPPRQRPSGLAAPLSPESPFYHELDPNLPQESRENVPVVESPTSAVEGQLPDTPSTVCVE